MIGAVFHYKVTRLRRPYRRWRGGINRGLMVMYEMSERILRKRSKGDTLTPFPFFCLRINEYKKDIVLVP